MSAVLFTHSSNNNNKTIQMCHVHLQRAHTITWSASNEITRMETTKRHDKYELYGNYAAKKTEKKKQHKV